MTNYRRDFLDGGSDVFTANLADRRPTRLTEPIGRLRSAFCEVRVPYPFTIKAAVIRPDHRHAISTLPEKDANFVLALPARLAEIRSPRRVNPGAKAALMSRQPNAGIWQRRYWEHLRDESDFARHLDYIRYN